MKLDTKSDPSSTRLRMPMLDANSTARDSNTVVAGGVR